MDFIKVARSEVGAVMTFDFKQNGCQLKAQFLDFSAICIGLLKNTCHTSMD